MRFNWCFIQQDGRKLAPGTNMQIDHVSGRCSVHIKAVTGDDEGEYLCEARNEFGVTSTSQQLLVNCRYFSISALSYLCLLENCRDFNYISVELVVFAADRRLYSALHDVSVFSILIYGRPCPKVYICRVAQNHVRCTDYSSSCKFPTVCMCQKL